MNELITIDDSRKGRAVIAAFLTGLKPTTRRAYLADLAHFAGHIGVPDEGTAFEALFELAPGDGNAALHAYRGALLTAGLSPATVNRRLSTLRSIVKLARTLGYTEWRPEIQSVRTQAFRDTAGPGIDGIAKMLAKADEQAPMRAARDRAIIRTMFDLGLRRNEVSTLDVEHIEIDRSRLSVLGKGHLERIPMTIPEPTVEALKGWLTSRASICPPVTGPAFVSLSGPTWRQRLSGDGLYSIIKALGASAGIDVSPHEIRHSSITAFLDASNGDLRSAQRHARHASANTTLKYDDNRADLAGQAARTVANLVK